MNQSSYIAAFLVVGFIVFITIRGELRAYLDVLGIDSLASGTTATTANAATPAQTSALAGALGSLAPLALG